MRYINKILGLIIIFLLTVLITIISTFVWSNNMVKASNIKYNKISNEMSKENINSEELYIKLENDETNNNIGNNNSNFNNVIAENKYESNKDVSVSINIDRNSKEWLDEFNKNIQQLQKEFPDGYYWNHANGTNNINLVTTTPCNHKNGKYYCNVYNSNSTRACGFSIGGQCAGFASMLSDRIFGKDANVKKFYNYDDIRVGDQARIDNNGHTVFIIEKTDDYVVVAECNSDYKTCIIRWGRKISRNKLKGYYLTRY